MVFLHIKTCSIRALQLSSIIFAGLCSGYENHKQIQPSSVHSYNPVSYELFKQSYYHTNERAACFPYHMLLAHSTTRDRGLRLLSNIASHNRLAALIRAKWYLCLDQASQAAPLLQSLLSCPQADPQAHYLWGIMLLYGWGIPQNQEQGAYYLMQAAQPRNFGIVAPGLHHHVYNRYYYHVPALEYLGYICMHGLGVTLDTQKAGLYYQRATQLSNSPVAWHNLGALHLSMHRYEDAFYCYQRAAEQGYMPSLVNMGIMLAQGHPYYDEFMASRYITYASQKKDPYALYVQGQLYINSALYPFSYKKAFNCFRLLVTDNVVSESNAYSALKQAAFAAIQDIAYRYKYIPAYLFLVHTYITGSYSIQQSIPDALQWFSALVNVLPSNSLTELFELVFLSEAYRDFVALLAESRVSDSAYKCLSMFWYKALQGGLDAIELGNLHSFCDKSACWANYYLGVMYAMKLGLYREACQCFKQALTVSKTEDNEVFSKTLETLEFLYNQTGYFEALCLLLTACTHEEKITHFLQTIHAPLSIEQWNLFVSSGAYEQCKYYVENSKNSKLTDIWEQYICKHVPVLIPDNSAFNAIISINQEHKELLATTKEYTKETFEETSETVSVPNIQHEHILVEPEPKTHITSLVQQKRVQELIELCSNNADMFTLMLVPNIEKELIQLASTGYPRIWCLLAHAYIQQDNTAKALEYIHAIKPDEHYTQEVQDELEKVLDVLSKKNFEAYCAVAYIYAKGLCGIQPSLDRLKLLLKNSTPCISYNWKIMNSSGIPQLCKQLIETTYDTELAYYFGALLYTSKAIFKNYFEKIREAAEKYLAYALEANIKAAWLYLIKEPSLFDQNRADYLNKGLSNTSIEIKQLCLQELQVLMKKCCPRAWYHLICFFLHESKYADVIEYSESALQALTHEQCTTIFTEKICHQVQEIAQLGNWRGHSVLGKIYYNRGEHEKARHYFIQALTTARTNNEHINWENLEYITNTNMVHDNFMVACYIFTELVTRHYKHAPALEHAINVSNNIKPCTLEQWEIFTSCGVYSAYKQLVEHTNNSYCIHNFLALLRTNIPHIVSSNDDLLKKDIEKYLVLFADQGNEEAIKGILELWDKNLKNTSFASTTALQVYTLYKNNKHHNEIQQYAYNTLTTLKNNGSLEAAYYLIHLLINQKLYAVALEQFIDLEESIFPAHQNNAQHAELAIATGTLSLLDQEASIATKEQFLLAYAAGGAYMKRQQFTQAGELLLKLYKALAADSSNKNNEYSEKVLSMLHHIAKQDINTLCQLIRIYAHGHYGITRSLPVALHLCTMLSSIDASSWSIIRKNKIDTLYSELVKESKNSAAIAQWNSFAEYCNNNCLRKHDKPLPHLVSLADTTYKQNSHYLRGKGFAQGVLLGGGFCFFTEYSLPEVSLLINSFVVPVILGNLAPRVNTIAYLSGFIPGFMVGLFLKNKALLLLSEEKIS